MSERKRKKKAYYMQSKKNCNRQQLEADLKGFLITCGNKSEKQAVREAYNVLNEYADKLYGEEVKKSVSIENETTEMDFAKAIAQQVDAEKPSGKDHVRRFQAVETKTNNCLFVRTTIERPDELLSSFLSDVSTTGITKSRFILKIFPVMGTCRAVEDKIEKLVEDILRSQFSDRSLGSYAVVYKVRCNNLGREHILPLIGRVVHQVCPGSKVNLSSPDFVISVDVLAKFCFVSVMKDFYQLKKYNIQELGKVPDTAADVCPVDKPNDSDVVLEVKQDTCLIGENRQELDAAEVTQSDVTSTDYTKAMVSPTTDDTSTSADCSIALDSCLTPNVLT